MHTLAIRVEHNAISYNESIWRRLYRLHYQFGGDTVDKAGNVTSETSSVANKLNIMSLPVTKPVGKSQESTNPNPNSYNIFLLWFQWNYQNISVTIYLVAFYFYTIDPHKGKSQNPYIQLILFFSQVCLFFLVSWMPSMATFLAYLYAAKYAKFGHICIFGYNQIYYKYVHDGYSQKEHNKTSNFVKKSSQLDVWGFSLIM